MTNQLAALVHTDAAPDWQTLLSDLISDPEELLELLELDARHCPYSLDALKQFPLKAPRPYVARIQKGDWRDPLLRQIWPAPDEDSNIEGFVADPLGEEGYNPVPGLLHKYQGRVLLTAAPHCAIHCRYCFRRHFDYHANSPSRSQWQAAFDYIAGDDSIEEVILSGGDPLALSDRHFSWLMERLADIPQLTTVRIHTRLPIVIPERITQDLLSCLNDSRLRVVMVVHCNHSQELDAAVGDSLRTLGDYGVTMLNQSVVLRDVNDSSTTLIELSKSLFQLGVLPYYLHMPDRVAGTEHFDVSQHQAEELITALHAALPGYLVPRLVREIPGEQGKTRLA